MLAPLDEVPGNAMLDLRADQPHPCWILHEAAVPSEGRVCAAMLFKYLMCRLHFMVPAVNFVILPRF